MDISDGIIDLVEIFRIVCRACHTAQTFKHFLRVAPRGHHLRLTDASVEGRFVGRRLAQAFSVCLIGRLGMPERRLHLGEQEIKTGTLCFSAFPACRLPQIGQRLFKAALFEQKISHAHRLLAPQTRRQRVTSCPFEGVFGIVKPVFLRIAAGQPNAGFCSHQWFGGILAGDV